MKKYITYVTLFSLLLIIALSVTTAAQFNNNTDTSLDEVSTDDAESMLDNILHFVVYRFAPIAGGLIIVGAALKYAADKGEDASILFKAIVGVAIAIGAISVVGLIISFT